MGRTICGADCSQCWMKADCGGCAETGGRPFGGPCVAAACCQSRGQAHCGECTGGSCGLRARLISEFNALGIADMETVTDLNALRGSFVNLEYTLPNGRTVKFLDDDKIYLGNQVHKRGSGRCYGIAADEKFLLVCEYGDGGTDPEIVVYQKRA